MFVFEFCVQLLGDRLIIITRPDKKKVLFYNDKAFHLQIDEGRLVANKLVYYMNF